MINFDVGETRVHKENSGRGVTNIFDAWGKVDQMCPFLQSEEQSGTPSKRPPKICTREGAPPAPP